MPVAFSIKGIGRPASQSADWDSSAGLFFQGTILKENIVNPQCCMHRGAGIRL